MKAEVSKWLQGNWKPIFIFSAVAWICWASWMIIEIRNGVDNGLYEVNQRMDEMTDRTEVIEDKIEDVNITVGSIRTDQIFREH